MHFASFWLEDAPQPHLTLCQELPASVDVAIVGGGYTGLSAARTLARAGASVLVLERHTIGWGASSRNGGITGCGLKAGMPTLFRRYGEELALRFWQASLDALALVRELVDEEGIDCDFVSQGDLCVAWKPSHYEGFQQKAAWHRKHLGHELTLVPPHALQNEIGSTAYYGGIIDPHGAGLHPAKLVFGLARVAARVGALLCEQTDVQQVQRQAKGFAVHTNRGVVQAADVIVASNGYTGRLIPDLRSRVIPVGSYCIVTEPLSPALQAQISPRGRVFWDSKWFLNYFRLTPDGRLLWGGRNNLSTDLDLSTSARILTAQMQRAFPMLRDVAITHSWSGQLGITFDLMPHIGRLQGVHYALGFGGHGLHMALYTGREVARLLSGERHDSPFASIPHPHYFFYRHRTWFLPLVGQYYRLRDALS